MDQGEKIGREVGRGLNIRIKGLRKNIGLERLY